MSRAIQISGNAHKLASLLCWKYGSRGGPIFPSQATLAADLGVTDRTIRNLLKELIPIGLKVTIKRGPRGGEPKSFYSFDGPIEDLIIPETDFRNSAFNSGNEFPELQTNSGKLTSEFRKVDDHNSGKNFPTNHESTQEENQGSNQGNIIDVPKARAGALHQKAQPDLQEAGNNQPDHPGEESHHHEGSSGTNPQDASLHSSTDGAPAAPDVSWWPDYIENFQGDAIELLDWWRSKARYRAMLTLEKQLELSKIYQAKFNTLSAEG